MHLRAGCRTFLASGARLLGEEGEQGAHALVGILEPFFLVGDRNGRQLVALGFHESLQELSAI